MSLTTEQVQGRVPITVLEIHGDLDYANYLEVVEEVRNAYAHGARHLLIDLSEVAFMGSSGIVALHSAALIIAGQEPPDPEGGWQAFHAIAQSQLDDIQARVKLLNPQPRVEHMLERTSVKRFFEIHTDRDAAISAF